MAARKRPETLTTILEHPVLVKQAVALRHKKKPPYIRQLSKYIADAELQRSVNKVRVGLFRCNTYLTAY